MTNSKSSHLTKGNISLILTIISILVVGLVIFIADQLGFTGDWRGRATNPGATYYVDCVAGSDADGVLGTSESTAWKTVQRANRATLTENDKLLFKRGCTWTKTGDGVFLNAHWDGVEGAPITIGAYGTGAKPILQSDARGTSRNLINVDVTGSHIVVENIHTKVLNHYRERTCLQSDGSGVRLGWYVGFTVSGSNNMLKDVEASEMSIGVNLTDNSRNNEVTNANIHDLNALWRINKVSKALGGLGVNLHGDENEVAYSVFERNGAQCNYVDDGMDQNYSAPFEIYNANKSYVHHNKAYEHRKHYEMGKATDKTSSGNVLAYNLFVSSKPLARGPNIHGGGNPFGPINDTQIYHNTIVFTGADSEALICTCDGGATIKNNIFIAEKKAAYYSGNFTERNNFYWDFQKTSDTTPDPLVQFSGSRLTAINSESFSADPLFINPVVPGGNFHLKAESTGLNRATGILTLDLNLISILRRDLENIDVPQANAAEIGALETFVPPSPVPSPTPTPTPSPVSTPTPEPSPTIVPGDEPPSVSFESLRDGDVVARSSVVNIEVNASDDKGVSEVEFFIDGDRVAGEETAPYRYSWKVSGRRNAQYTLRAKVTDSVGQVKNTTIIVTSSN